MQKIFMATCSFASLAHVTSPCGSSSRDPQDVQCITLGECNEDVSTHLKKSNVGPDTINDEKTFLHGQPAVLAVFLRLHEFLQEQVW